MRIIAAALSAVLLCAAPSWSVEVKIDTEFDELLKGVNLEAEADLAGFAAKLSARFGGPVEKAQAVVKEMAKPADAFMAFKVAEVAQKPVDEVVTSYKAEKDKGWGQIARSMGIKPGSPEFKALKKSDLKGKGKDKGKDKSKGKSEEKGKGKGKGKGK